MSYSPRARHYNRVRNNAEKRQRDRARRFQQTQEAEAERLARATPSRPPCVCVPGFCFAHACTPCASLAPDDHCLRDAQ